MSPMALTPTQKQLLSKIPVFSDLAPTEVDFLDRHAVPRTYAAGQLIFSEGDPCSGLFMVASGYVRIFKTSPGGREQVLSIDGPGTSIAELPVFDGGAYPASALAVDEATLLFVSKEAFRELCLTHPQVALKVLRVVGLRLRRLVEIIEELSFTTVRHRLAAFLLRIANQDGIKAGRKIVVTLPDNNQEIAAQIGTVRELVSRNLSRLQAEGVIEIDGRNLTILNPSALQAEVESAE
jgi:CRP/FNR family transcriptional regulator